MQKGQQQSQAQTTKTAREDPRTDLVNMLNEALALEHAARIQYLAHAQVITGINAEPIISRIKEIADDEGKHAEQFREMIGTYLGSVPSMCLAETHCPGTTIEEILQANLDIEKTSVEFYAQILQKIHDLKPMLKYEYFQLEHMMRHIVMDEEEHISELSLLLG
jgi:bacterioferritin (cytochrome b1)